jgi:hypothetical protein
MKGELRTIEECIQIIVVHLTKFQEVLASFRTLLHLKVDDEVA